MACRPDHGPITKVQQPAEFYAEKRINECCHGDGMQVAYVSNVTRPLDAIQHHARSGSCDRSDPDVAIKAYTCRFSCRIVSN